MAGISQLSRDIDAAEARENLMNAQAQEAYARANWSNSQAGMLPYDTASTSALRYAQAQNFATDARLAPSRLQSEADYRSALGTQARSSALQAYGMWGANGDPLAQSFGRQLLGGIGMTAPQRRGAGGGTMVGTDDFLPAPGDEDPNSPQNLRLTRGLGAPARRAPMMTMSSSSLTPSAPATGSLSGYEQRWGLGAPSAPKPGSGQSYTSRLGLGMY